MNSAYGVSVENLLSTLPSVLQNDGDMAAIASGIAVELAARPREIDLARIYPHR